MRVKDEMSLWNGMWHDLQNGIIMPNVIYAKWLKEINLTQKVHLFWHQFEEAAAD